MTRLADARLYLVAPARIRAGALSDLVPELVDAGVDVVQLREKELPAGDILSAAEPVAQACRDSGVPFIVNDRADLALAVEADGVHLGQDDGPVWLARRVLGDGIVGLSTHSDDQIETAMGDEVDYIAVGPVRETPTKPGRASAGFAPLRYAASRCRGPWFAIGGINSTNVDEVLEAGARRVVVVRAITEATDPARAAADLRDRLNTVPIGR